MVLICNCGKETCRNKLNKKATGHCLCIKATNGMEYTKDVDSNLTMIFLVEKGPSPFIGNNQYTLLKYIANNAGMYTGKETEKM